MSDTLRRIFEAVLVGRQDQTVAEVQAALQDGLSPESILKQGLVAAMAEVGDRFERGEYYVPEMLIAARAMQAGLNVLKPLLVEADIQPAGRVVIGTVKGDLHDIGKNLVAMMLEGAGYEIIDLGTDVAPQEFAQAARDSKADFVGMSALLTTTMPQMRNTIEALEDMGVRESVCVIIGGAPITQDYCEQIGADGFAPDASRAVALARDLMGVRPQTDG
jgi:5-methyltetrahydrofolate--homocysteine methyltransferase